MNIITVDGNNYLKEKFLLEKGINLDLLKLFKNTNCYVAGGAITSIFSGNKINDYDIYFCTEFDYRDFIIKLPTNSKLEWQTENAKSYKIDKETFQFICKPSYMGSPGEVLTSFDFTICMGAYSFKEDKFYFYDNFFRNLACKELIFNIKASFPISSLFRLRKFLKKEYKISGCEIIKLGLSIEKLKIDTYVKLIEQLMGIDIAFLKDLIDTMNTCEFNNKTYDFDEFLKMIDVHILNNYSKVFEE